MRNIFYGIFAVGLLLLSSNIYASSTPDCKPSFHIQPIKGNYISLLNGDVENLEKFLLELAEQNAIYCNASLKIDFKKGLETKQTITHGKAKFKQKLYLEIQYLTPSYEAIIENADGDILHKIALGQKLKSIKYDNSELENHDALYAEWRRIRRGNFSQMETEENNFEALIDFLKIENGMSVPENSSLAMNEKKEILSGKGAEEKTNLKSKTAKKKVKSKSKKRSSRRKSKKESKKAIAKRESKTNQKEIKSKAKKATSPTKPKEEAQKVIAKTESKTSQKEIKSKAKKTTSPAKSKEEAKKVIAKKESKPNQKEIKSKAKKETLPAKTKEETKKMIAKSESKTTPKVLNKKEEKPKSEKKKRIGFEDYSVPMTSEEVAKTEDNSKSKTTVSPTKTKQESTKTISKVESKPSEKPSEIKPKKSFEKPSGPREIISDDEMFGAANVAEPLAEFIRFDFFSSKKYRIINDGEFSLKINTGRESGKVFSNNSLKPTQEKEVKNKFKKGDWYSIEYPEKLHKKDVENYQESIEDILSELKLSDYEDDIEKMIAQLMPNLDIINNENPLANNEQAQRVEKRFQQFVLDKKVDAFKEGKNPKPAKKIKALMTLIIQSHQLHHYYKYTVGSSAAQRPINKLSNFRRNY